MHPHATSAASEGLRTTVEHLGPIFLFGKAGSRPIVVTWKLHRGPTTREGYRRPGLRLIRQHDDMEGMHTRTSDVERLGSREKRICPAVR